MKKYLIIPCALLTLLGLILISGCGATTTFNLGNKTAGETQVSGITLKKVGSSWQLQAKAKTKKDGRLTFTLNVTKEKGKSKVTVSKELLVGKPTTVDEKTDVTGNLKDCKIYSVAFQPYEFTTKDYPMEPGRQLVYYAEKETQFQEKPTPFAVNFNLEGPWDFSQGPTEGQVVYDYMGPKGSPDAVDFPDANGSRKNSYTSGTQTIFYKRDPGSIQMLGFSDMSLLSAVSEIVKYNPPDLTYKMPFKVGDTWQSSIESTYSGRYSGKGKEDNTSKVISKNSIKVPQGEYEISYLVQDRYHAIDTDGTESNYIYYSWLVPSVGAVAYIYSVNGEQNEVFSQATSFRRLKYVGTKKPGL